MPRSSKLALLAGVVVLLAGVGLLVATLMTRPHRQVALPPTSASPQQVVRTYVAALDARDFATSNDLLVGSADTAWHFDRFDHAPHIDNLTLGKPRETAGDPGTSAARYRYAIEIPAEFDLSGGDSSMPDGPTVWGYTLARSTRAEPWRIVDQGTG